MTLVVLGAASIMPAPAAAQLPSYSTEFRVNSYTTGLQQSPSVAIAADGGFVVSWRGRTQESIGFLGRQLLRKYAADTTPLTGELSVSEDNETQSIQPCDVGPTADGFIVVWSLARPFQDGVETNGVAMRKLALDGTPAGTEFFVNEFTTYNQFEPRIAMFPSGDAIVVWTSYGQDVLGSNGGGGIYARRFDSSGAPTGSEFRVNGYTTQSQVDPAVAARPDGSFVVAWTDGGQRDGDDDGIFARSFDASDVPAGADSQVNIYTTRDQSRPGIVTLPDDSFVVSWEGRSHYLAGATDIFLRKYSAVGAPLTGEIVVNTYTSGLQWEPAIASYPDGSFIVTWSGVGGGEDTDGLDVWARKFDSSATPLADPFVVNAYTRAAQRRPRVAASDDGGFVAVWEADEQDGEDEGVFGIRECIGTAADDDGDGVRDDCDPCVNLDGLLLDGKPKVRFKFVNTDVNVSNDRFAFSGELDLPVGTVFADLDPTDVPIAFRVESGGRVGILEGELPALAYTGTVGWKTNAPGSAWTYKDKSGGPVEGIIKVVLKDQSKKAPGRIRLKVKGKNGFYAVGRGDEPLRVIFVFGDAAAGGCGETAFVADDCRFSGLDSTVSCRSK